MKNPFTEYVNSLQTCYGITDAQKIKLSQLAQKCKGQLDTRTQVQCLADRVAYYEARVKESKKGMREAQTDARYEAEQEQGAGLQKIVDRAVQDLHAALKRNYPTLMGVK